MCVAVFCSENHCKHFLLGSIQTMCKLEWHHSQWHSELVWDPFPSLVMLLLLSCMKQLKINTVHLDADTAADAQFEQALINKCLLLLVCLFSTARKGNQISLLHTFMWIRHHLLLLGPVQELIPKKCCHLLDKQLNVLHPPKGNLVKISKKSNIGATLFCLFQTQHLKTSHWPISGVA